MIGSTPRSLHNGCCECNGVTVKTYLSSSWVCSWTASFCCGCCGCWIPPRPRRCSCCHPRNHCPRQAHPPHSVHHERQTHYIKKKSDVCTRRKQTGKTVPTDERFRLLLKPPSLILRGATFLVLALFFFSCGLGVVFDFLRALGPANTTQKGGCESRTEPRRNRTKSCLKNTNKVTNENNGYKGRG